ncbi:MAG TPA: hypothetical protein VK203_09645 [Nostocaceae cyanobacterium]|nr:hypothetical protein [Nostocaceae cyanobacterium]
MFVQGNKITSELLENLSTQQQEILTGGLANNTSGNMAGVPYLRAGSTLVVPNMIISNPDLPATPGV